MQAPIPYRNNVIKTNGGRLRNLPRAPIPYRNNVIDIKERQQIVKRLAPIPYRNNVIMPSTQLINDVQGSNSI